MKSVFRILSILISLMILFPTNANAQSSRYENCPAAFIRYWYGGGAYTAIPEPMGPYDTVQGLEDAIMEVSNRPNPKYKPVYTHIGRGLWDLYYLGSGDERHYIASAEIRAIPTCPNGFSEVLDWVCVNDVTKACECPAGEKLKKSSNQCVPVKPAPPEPDPSKDRGPDCPNGNGEPLQPQCGNPINPSNGNKIQFEKDFVLNGSAASLSLTRIYNGTPNNQTDYARSFIFGKNWSTNFESKVTWIPKPRKVSCYIWNDDLTKFCEYEGDASSGNVSTALVLRPSGNISNFQYNSSTDKFTGDPGSKDELFYSNTPNRHLVFVQGSDGSVYEYDGVHSLLTSIRKIDGTSLYFTHLFTANNDSRSNRIPSSAPICNNVQTNGTVYPLRIGCITDNWGRQVNFEYEALPRNSYAARVSKIIDPSGNEYLYSYDGITTGCDGDYFNVACGSNNLTSIKYPDGTTRLYHYNERAHISDGNICPGDRVLGPGLGNLPYALTGITDENGIRFASWTYDCAGRATSSEHAGGAERVEVAYEDANAQGMKRSTVKTFTGPFESPVITSNVLTAEIINGRSKNTSSDGACLGCGEALQRTYDVNGNISSFTDQNNHLSKFEYDLSRNLQISRTEAFGTPNARKISTVWHSQYNKPVQIFKPMQITTLTYDASGNVLTRSIQSTSDANGMSGINALGTGLKKTWSYIYNLYGQITSIISPRSDVVDRTSISYDEHGNIASVTNALNHSTLYSNYDMNGRVGTITSANGSISTISYTPRGKVSRMETNYGTTIEHTSYVYDNVGQVRKISAADGTFIDLHYDDAHRLVRTTNSAGDSVDYILDIQGNRIGERTKNIDGTLVRNISRAFDALNQLQQEIGVSN